MKRNKKTNESRKMYNKYNAMLPPKRHEPGSSVCLVVDGMNIAYQAFYAYKNLSYKGKSTSILFGFLNILRPILLNYKPHKVVICWDGLKHPKRLEVLPDYKGHRDKKRDKEQHGKFLAQVDRVKKLIYRLGIPQAHDEEVEGDDMVYMITKTQQLLSRVLIVSGDKDFYQLVNNDVSLYNPRTKHITTPFAFDAENSGLAIPQFVDYLCLVGDDSDDIPGYPNTGPVRAGGVLRKYGSIKEYLNSDDDFAGMVDKEKLKKIYKRNRVLIDLAYFYRKFYKKRKPKFYKKSRSPKFNEEKYKAICSKHRLITMVSERFLAPFKELQQ